MWSPASPVRAGRCARLGTVAPNRRSFDRFGMFARAFLRRGAVRERRAGSGRSLRRSWKDRMIAFAVTAAPAGELSLWHLVIQASWIVQLVMFGLAAASVWSWSIIIEKFFAVRKMNAA